MRQTRKQGQTQRRTRTRKQKGGSTALTLENVLGHVAASGYNQEAFIPGVALSNKSRSHHLIDSLSVKKFKDYFKSNPLNYKNLPAIRELLASPPPSLERFFQNPAVFSRLYKIPYHSKLTILGRLMFLIKEKRDMIATEGLDVYQRLDYNSINDLKIEEDIAVLLVHRGARLTPTELSILWVDFPSDLIDRFVKASPSVLSDSIQQRYFIRNRFRETIEPLQEEIGEIQKIYRNEGKVLPPALDPAEAAAIFAAGRFPSSEMYAAMMIAEKMQLITRIQQRSDKVMAILDTSAARAPNAPLSSALSLLNGSDAPRLSNPGRRGAAEKLGLGTRGRPRRFYGGGGCSIPIGYID